MPIAASGAASIAESCGTIGRDDRASVFAAKVATEPSREALLLAGAELLPGVSPHPQAIASATHAQGSANRRVIILAECITIFRLLKLASIQVAVDAKPELLNDNYKS